MRGTTLLVAATIAATLLLCPPAVQAEEEAGGPDAPVQAAEYLGTLRHALVIGIDDYADRSIPDLRVRESSARALAAVLQDPLRGGLPEANVQVLLGKEATATKIRAALEALQTLPKEATVLVSFAGHGGTRGEDAYWVPQDAKAKDLPRTAVADAEVRRLLGLVPAERILLLLDCCHDAALGGTSDAQEDSREILARYGGDGHATLGAAAPEEHTVAVEDVERSVFTHHLVTGLSGEADDDGDGIVVLGELAAYVKNGMRVERRARKDLDRPLLDAEDVLEPSRFLLTIDPESFRELLRDDVPAQTRRTARLAALTALRGKKQITADQERIGRHLLGTLEESLGSQELDEHPLFVDLAEGRLGPEYLTDALVAIRRTDRRTLVVPDEFKTIQAAIDAAAAGDTVFVKEGRYEEHVVFKNGLCLRGEGHQQTLLSMVPGKPEVLLAQDCAWGVIEELQIDGTGGTQIDDWRPDGVHLERSSVRVRDCLIYNCLGCGMYANGKGCRPYVWECMFEQNGQDGMCFGEAEGGAIVECICRHNGAVGIQVRPCPGKIHIRDCRCEFNEHAGIGVCGGSTATLEGNDCQSNGGHGILVWDRKTSVFLEDNSCSGNQIYGVYLAQGATAVANGTLCDRNREGGFVVAGTGSSATIARSRCADNDLSDKGSVGGIAFREGARGEATSNTCTGNALGILVEGPGSSAQLENNTCRGNKASGISFSSASGGQAVGNRCDENGYGISVSRTEVTLQDNKLRRNTADGVFISERATCTATGNRCEENEQAGIHVTGMGTNAELVKNTCAANKSHGIQFARGAGGTADDNDCSGNKGFGIGAFDSGTRPTFRRNRCTNNGRAGIGKEQGAAPTVESDNVQSGNGK